MIKSNRSVRSLTLSIILLIFATCSVVAQPFNVIIKDQNGSPVYGAVLVYDTAETPANPTQPEPAIMDQVERQFSPFVLAIHAGDSVAFPNSDDIRHHVYSFSAPHAFEIRLYKGKPSKPEIFANSGVVELGCNIHDKMRGFIYVSDSPFSNATNEQGFTTIPETSISNIKVWHPRISRDRLAHLDITLPNKNQHGMFELTLPLIPGVDQETHTEQHGFKKRFSN